MVSNNFGKPAEIGINAHLLSGQPGYRRAGIHHYISQLLNHLPADEKGLHFTVFTNQATELIPGQSLSVVRSRWPTGKRIGRILWEQLAWPWAARKLQLDLLHSLAFVTPIVTRRPALVTVYDLSFIHHPDRFPLLQRLYLTSQTGRSCQRANRVITISEAGRQDVSQIFGVPFERIDVVYPGVDDIYTPRSAAELTPFRQRQELGRPYILHVGTLQPRKNIPILIEAFHLLNRPDLDLVLVGGKGWLYDEIFARVQQLGLTGRVRFTGYVPDSDLPLWYNAAAVLVFPSIYEGFGLPVVQAMACGTPVIAAQTSAVPEVAGDAALFFEPADPQSLASHISTVLDDSELAATMRAGGLDRAQRFTWFNAGQKMTAIYRQVLAELN